MFNNSIYYFEFNNMAIFEGNLTLMYMDHLEIINYNPKGFKRIKS